MLVIERPEVAQQAKDRWRQPPAEATFSRAIRADPRINVTVRVCWLMATLARRSGFASMSVERMAVELDVSVDAIKQARRKLVFLELFEREDGWRWRCVGGKADFTTHCIGNRRLDLSGRILWLLDWLTEQDGRAALSLPEAGRYLGVTSSNVAPAMKRILTLGHFAVDRSARTNVYMRVDWQPPITAPHESGQEPASNFSGYKRQRRTL